MYIFLRAVEKYKPILNSDSSTQEKALMKYWLGGMFVPHSFIMATRQHSAQVVEFFMPMYTFICP
jgi:hypothetical protein